MIQCLDITPLFFGILFKHKHTVTLGFNHSRFKKQSKKKGSSWSGALKVLVQISGRIELLWPTDDIPCEIESLGIFSFVYNWFWRQLTHTFRLSAFSVFWGKSVVQSFITWLRCVSRCRLLIVAFFLSRFPLFCRCFCILFSCVYGALYFYFLTTTTTSSSFSFLENRIESRKKVIILHKCRDIFSFVFVQAPYHVSTKFLICFNESAYTEYIELCVRRYDATHNNISLSVVCVCVSFFSFVSFWERKPTFWLLLLLRLLISFTSGWCLMLLLLLLLLLPLVNTVYSILFLILHRILSWVFHLVQMCPNHSVTAAVTSFYRRVKMSLSLLT